ncbi:MAG TPA: lipopolysaccharide kinase InaA family protein [Flavobacterium sp.]|uniref:lipopolysaccharide kinase InaA family protein n=1 Tax=unclassified Flavobacterium TaxID=196869 RepID=UPI0025BF7B0F|nr:MULTISPECIES: lipopolysaccharide kinase InaA family protein [unclassified Flavobacterium]HRE77216.1 lipopolysaccharide kinase InaA family protein [Flavobacterium sp.]
MKSVIISTKFKLFQNELLDVIDNFNEKGKLFDNRIRNKIKLFEFNGFTINVKSFKKPNFINKIVYRYFRKSKAKRSFEFANKLLENGIGTPQPIAFYENFDLIGLNDSYYISEHLNCDLTFRELVLQPDYPEWELILRKFTKFSYKLHQKGIEFKDHSPGNTLIKKNENNDYDFYLVDLNRMEFHSTMSFNMRMKNLCRLTPHKEMIAIMSNEYAKSSQESEQLIFEILWKYTSDFQNKFQRKKRLKKKFLFWK